MTTVLYLIASHKDQDQVVRLAKTISEGSPGSIIMIHHDSSHCAIDDEQFKAIPNAILLKNTTQVEWGGISMVQMVLNCFSYIIENSIKFDWFVFISGQDYPIKPISEIEQYLENTKYDGFMKYFSLESNDAFVKQLIVDRYYFRYLRLPRHWRISKFLNRIIEINRHQSLFRIFPGSRNANPRLGIRRFYSIFDKDFACYKGQFWMTLSNKCVQYLSNYFAENSSTLKYYSSCIHPDESIFQTILVNNKKLLIKNEHLRYLEWSNENLSHPKTLDANDLDKIISSNKHFARKLDRHTNSKIFELLDEHVKKI